MRLRMLFAFLLTSSALMAQTTKDRTVVFNSYCNGSGCLGRVPPNVTQFTVEGWGGGGGGNQYGGGQGGSYFKAVVAVTPNAVYNVSVGLGGNNGNAGGTTLFNYQGVAGAGVFQLKALGGAGGNATGGGYTNSLADGSSGAGVGNNNIYFRGCIGQPGTSASTVQMVQRTATSVFISVAGGNGGSACNAPGTGGAGGSENSLMNMNGYAYSVIPSPLGFNFPEVAASAGVEPGGGGGGSASIGSKIPAPGGPGLIVISYTLP